MNKVGSAINDHIGMYKPQIVRKENLNELLRRHLGPQQGHCQCC
jgi:hypothetical protein